MSTSLQSSLRGLLAVALGMAACSLARAAGEPSAMPREVGRIELPGVDGRLDHLSLDTQGRRLFVAALGADKIEVVDLKAGRRMAELSGVREPQGIAFVPATRRLLVAGGESADIVAFDDGRRATVASGLPDADNLRFVAQTGQVFAGFGSGLIAIDPASLAKTQRIALPGHPEAFEIAAHGPEIYVNVPSVGRIVVVDRRTGKTTAEWSIAPEAANFPMALDEAGHRLYVGTRRPAKLLAYDTSNGRRVSESPLCGDVDDLFFDSQAEQLLAVCGEGEVDIIATRGGAGVAHVATAVGARTGLFDPASRTLFVAAPARPGRSAEVLLYRLP